MHLTVKCPFAKDEHAQVLPVPGKTLGMLFATHRQGITGCQVNGAFIEQWDEYLPAPGDRIVLFVDPQLFESFAAFAAWAIQAIAVAVIGTAISIGLQYLIRSLTPTKSQTEGKPEQVYGIAGLTNTTAQGTPKLICYGKRRVYGHILSTRVFVTGGAEDDGEKMLFSILYYMGEGPIQSLTQPQIDDVDVSQYAGVSYHTRLGGVDNATLIHADFTQFSQVWSDGRQLPLAQPIVYQTRSSLTTRAYPVFFTPFLRSDGGGAAEHTIRVEISTVAANAFFFNQVLSWNTLSISPRFGAVQIDFPSAGQWLIRLTLDATSNAQNTVPTLFNVMEEQAGSQLYPDSALLAFTGVANSQIQSFDAMRGSALEEGRLVKIWNGTSFTTEHTNRRAWILRDAITDTRVGFGNWIDESLFDDDAALNVQTYWSGETIPASGIPRDQCDILINDRKPFWDWLKILLSEGRATLIPSAGKLKLVGDRPGSPGLLYSMPGNIIEGSLSRTLGTGQGHIPNTQLLQFPDEADRFRPHLLPFRAPGTESDPDREASSLTAYSLIRYQHAYWMARAQLLRQRLVQRSFEWHSPATAMVSEPFDIATLAYDTPDFARGISGFLSSDSTTTRLVLDRIVTLEALPAYTVLVRHQATNVVESRALNMGAQAGQWGALLLATALSTAPALGDMWALGVTGTTLTPVVIEEVTQEADGTYHLTASEYQATLYEFPEPPDSPIPDSTDPPPAPPAGVLPPSAVVLQGAFGGSGTIALSWTAATASTGDTIAEYRIFTALGSPENVQPGFYIEGDTDFEMLTPELFDGYFTVQAVATQGGPGPLSNVVHAEWQFEFSGSD